MKQLNRYDFADGKAFVTRLFDTNDTFIRKLPECDVIELQRVDGERSRFGVMRPDEALILARLLIDAVWQVMEGYHVSKRCGHQETETVDDIVPSGQICPTCDALYTGQRWVSRDKC